MSLAQANQFSCLLNLGPHTTDCCRGLDIINTLLLLEEKRKIRQHMPASIAQTIQRKAQVAGMGEGTGPISQNHLITDFLASLFN